MNLLRNRYTEVKVTQLYLECFGLIIMEEIKTHLKEFDLNVWKSIPGCQIGIEH